MIPLVHDALNQLTYYGQFVLMWNIPQSIWYDTFVHTIVGWNSCFDSQIPLRTVKPLRRNDEMNK